KCKADRHCGCNTRRAVTYGGRNLRRTAVGFADQCRDSSVRCAHVIETGVLTKGPGLAGERDRAHDETRGNRPQPVIIEAGAPHDAGREVLYHHVNLWDQFLDQLPSPRMFDVDGEAFLGMIVLEIISALGRMFEVASRLVAGRTSAIAIRGEFDLNDLGAKLRQDTRASRTGDELCDVENAIAGEHGCFGVQRRPTGLTSRSRRCCLAQVEARLAKTLLKQRQPVVPPELLTTENEERHAEHVVLSGLLLAAVVCGASFAGEECKVLFVG